MHDKALSPDELRKLAVWYREFAAKSGNPMIWAMRLKTAEQLETEADRVENLAKRWRGDMG